MFFLAVGCALALVTHPLEGQTSRTFLATSLTKPLQAPRFDGHEHAALLQDTATTHSHARVEEAAEQPGAVYVPKIGVGNVTEATAFPPPPPTLNPVTDYQPLDTAIGDWIQKQFVEPPTITPPPSQDMLALYFSCPLLIMPARFNVKAPSGCGGTGRTGKWTNTDGGELLAWAEKPQSASDLDMAFTMPTGDTFGYATAEFSLLNSKIDFIDCGLNVQYFMTEKVFHQPGQKDENLCSRYSICDGSIFLKYEIYKQGGGMVAVSGLVPLFADVFTLSDAATGSQLVEYSRSAAWSPKECAEYDKEWVVSVGAGALSDPSLSWTLGMAIQTISMRDEDRDATGIIRMSTTQEWTWGISLAVLILGGLLLWGLVYLFNLYLKEHVTLSCIHIEDTFFPMTMYKNKSYT
jgi:hypothetical protein